MNHNKKVRCGDTQFCADCTMEDVSKRDPEIAQAEFSMNALGRCDFYDGPDKTVIHISRHH